MSEEMQDEWKVWRLVQEGKSLSELLTWDLDDLDKANSFLDMQADNESAFSEYKSQEAKKNAQRNK